MWQFGHRARQSGYRRPTDPDSARMGVHFLFPNRRETNTLAKMQSCPVLTGR